MPDSEEQNFYVKATKALARVPSKFGPEVFKFRRQRTIMEFWEEWFETERIENVDGPRLFTAWRIIREMCWIRGVITEQTDTLESSTKTHPSPWNAPFAFYYQESRDARINQLCKEHQVPLLPPPLPEYAFSTKRKYVPELDAELMTFIELSERVAIHFLHVNRCRDGRIGLTGLLDPEEARKSWPKAHEIMAYEEYMISCVYNSMVSADGGGGDHRTREELKILGLCSHEINQLFALARSRASKMSGMEDPKAYLQMQLSKMDRLADKMTAREDYRGAAQARRDVLRILSQNDQKRDEEDLDGIVELEMRKESKKRRISAEEDDILEG